MNEKIPHTIERLMKKYQISEELARFHLALAQGDITGDVYGMPEIDGYPTLEEQVELDKRSDFSEFEN